MKVTDYTSSEAPTSVLEKGFKSPIRENGGWLYYYVYGELP